MAFVTPVAEPSLEREIAQWIHHDESTWRLIPPRADVLERYYISFLSQTDAYTNS